MGWVQDYSGLLATRFFLGVTEAGLFPGVTYLCSTWYCRYELQFRIALFYCAASLAGSFSGLLAYGIGFMDGKHCPESSQMIRADMTFLTRNQRLQWLALDFYSRGHPHNCRCSSLVSFHMR